MDTLYVPLPDIHIRHPERVARMNRGRRWLALMLCLAVGVGCGSNDHNRSATALNATLDDAAKNYADKFLHFAATDANQLRAPDCPPLTDALVDRVHQTLEHLTGKPLSDLHVTGTQTRAVTATSGEAQATYDSSGPAIGNYNWLTFEKRDGVWVVTDCSRLPIGGSGDEASASASS